jgi:hypothetical protein
MNACCHIILFYVRHNKASLTTAKTAVFHLSTQTENSISTSALNGILGMKNNSKL